MHKPGKATGPGSAAPHGSPRPAVVWSTHELELAGRTHPCTSARAKKKHRLINVLAKQGKPRKYSATLGEVTSLILIVPWPHPSGRPFRKVSLRSRVGSGTMVPNTREHGRSIRVYAAMPLRMLERTDPSRNPAKRPRCTKPRRLARLKSSARASESSEEPAPYFFTQSSDARDCNSQPLPVPLTIQN